MNVVQTVQFTQFDWDEDKRQRVLVDREIDCLQVAQALLQPHLQERSGQKGEVRILAICMIGDQIVRAIFTPRGDTCHIITAMAARRYERKEYREVLGG